MEKYLAAAAALALALTFYVVYHFGYTHAENHYEAEAAKQKLQYEQKLRDVEKRLTDVTDAAANEYERGKRDAQTTAQSVVDGLRAGAVKLRAHWGACETQRLADNTAASIELGAAARDREESAGRIVRAAAECDTQVTSLQRVYNDVRRTMNEQR